MKVFHSLTESVQYSRPRLHCWCWWRRGNGSMSFCPVVTINKVISLLFSAPRWWVFYAIIINTGKTNTKQHCNQVFCVQMGDVHMHTCVCTNWYPICSHLLNLKRLNQWNSSCAAQYEAICLNDGTPASAADSLLLHESSELWVAPTSEAALQLLPQHRRSRLQPSLWTPSSTGTVFTRVWICIATQEDSERW